MKITIKEGDHIMRDIKNFFTKDDEKLILSAVQEAESCTSGEIRVRVEKEAGKYPMTAAMKAFDHLRMRNAKLHKIIFSCLAIILGVTLSIPKAQAQNEYPSPTNDYVNDYANALSQADMEAIRKMFQDLEYQTGIEAVVVTVNSIGDYHTKDATIEAFATNLFNAWGIGHKKENNGILILVAVKDRKCRIELGRGYEKRYDSIMKQVIDEKMIPYFKTDDYSRGIYEGARDAVEKVTKKVSWFSFYKWHIVIAVLIIVCIFAGVSCMRSGKRGWGWVFFAVAGMLFIFLFRMLSKGKSSGGFGGGGSSGGGASGNW
jgi:uncharacterized protein